MTGTTINDRNDVMLPSTIPEIASPLPLTCFRGSFVSARPRIPKMIAGMPVNRQVTERTDSQHQARYCLTARPRRTEVIGGCEIALGTRFWLRHDQLSLAYRTARASPRVFVPGLEFLPTFASNDNGHDGVLVFVAKPTPFPGPRASRSHERSQVAPAPSLRIRPQRQESRTREPS